MHPLVPWLSHHVPLSLATALVVFAAHTRVEAHVLDPVQDAQRTFKLVEDELAAGNHRTAALDVLALVAKLEEAAAGANADDRSTYLSVACSALELFLTRRRCGDVLERHATLQAAGVCPPPEVEIDHGPAEACEDPLADAVPPPPVPEPQHPPPPPPADVQPPRLLHTAIAAGALGATLLLSSAVMSAVVGRKNPEECTPLNGSYCRVYKLASTNDAVPNSRHDHLCSAEARDAAPELAQACVARDRLMYTAYVTAGLGAALGLTAIVTGALHATNRRGRTTPRPRAAMSLSPIGDRSWMFFTTLRF